ncbi:MAG: 50S ribosomal protein L25/L23, large subunit ribosomal protein L23 [Candidatus Peregrinibacteria bacterium GW2011_GWF2_33_10]|nr:MAG: 50S ribosomal protein L25/L23, large subunit ribosomal protein L23 [Candidatus Peregrinibacteria bacterium GW2011_GWF2_33_10]OGJ46135.1 MAG: 50S ribosomal protein L23 [Candidatus Peregrinibacteria bacterium RIFOXYA12_FULL_33_12]OGJ46159.1 MAG: 50S ribosomal protein L23 [Candidatus Peregrinibacteria bacterium RIFOXYA2_FULL_33_21]OGJ51576.1 MAG: 50S ribosomal protein L23 [Candidatus Peregrinibacteria bacterium RIFOXYB2_FULL_33_20]
MFDVIKKVIITEKSAAKNDKGVYVFEIVKNANKIDVKNAIQQIYGVKVATVKTVTLPSKSRMGRSRLPVMKRHACRKAIVTLKGNKTIDVNVFSKEEKEKSRKEKVEKKKNIKV